MIFAGHAAETSVDLIHFDEETRKSTREARARFFISFPSSVSIHQFATSLSPHHSSLLPSKPISRQDDFIINSQVRFLVSSPATSIFNRYQSSVSSIGGKSLATTSLAMFGINFLSTQEVQVRPAPEGLGKLDVSTESVHNLF